MKQVVSFKANYRLNLPAIKPLIVIWKILETIFMTHSKVLRVYSKMFNLRTPGNLDRVTLVVWTQKSMEVCSGSEL